MNRGIASPRGSRPALLALAALAAGGAWAQTPPAPAAPNPPMARPAPAARFAIRGFTDSLRAELIHENSRITLTMLQMPGMNTPQFDWARNKLPVRYQPVGGVFDPSVAGEAAWRPRPG